MAVPSRADLQKLDIATRLDLIEALWESIAIDEASAAQLPVTDAERAMLEERLREYRDGRSSPRPWAEIRAEILAKPR
ncbi:MAG TPA: addiction module protein [Kofleriaceae bacterium]